LALAAPATAQPRADRYGDPLPENAIARLGTARLRHADNIRVVAYSPDGKTLASAGSDSVIRLWHSETGRLLNELRGHRAHVLSLAFSPDSKRLASAGWGWESSTMRPDDTDNTIRVWNVESGKQVHQFRGSPPG